MSAAPLRYVGIAGETPPRERERPFICDKTGWERRRRLDLTKEQKGRGGGKEEKKKQR